MTSIRSIFRLKRKKKKLTNTLRTFVLIKYLKKKEFTLELSFNWLENEMFFG